MNEGLVPAPPRVGHGGSAATFCPRSLNSGPGMLFENWATWLV
jgi:hypothetical protein